MRIRKGTSSALTDLILQASAVSPEEMLRARDDRAARQRMLLAENSCPVVSLTLNIPGAYKAHSLAGKAFGIARAAVFRRLERMGMRVGKSFESAGKTGFEGLYAVAGDAATIKAVAVGIEETHPIGRLFDIDVLARDGVVLRGADMGRSERECVICGGPVWACSRSGAHSPEELSLRTAKMILEYINGEYADGIASLATKALLFEVLVSPKPGLVDCNNNGAHRDMNLFAFAASAAALTPYFRDMAECGLTFDGDPEMMLPSLRTSGIMAEERMFAATGGVNTHKGLVFSMGIFCAAAGYVHGGDTPFSAENILDACASIAAEAPGELASPLKEPETNGRRAYARFGLTGIRGEAAAGYPTIRQHGFPFFRQMIGNGCSFNDAGVATLLRLMAHTQDTNIVSRSSATFLAGIQSKIRKFLDARPTMAAILRFAERLDKRFISDNISPGGSADLLALVFFLHFILEFDSEDKSGGD